jgi:lipid-binding SYLF domain-containing protein
MTRIRLTLLLLVALAAGCVWQPIVYDESAQESVDKALAEFRKEEVLAPFFDEALAYAVFPGSFRAGTGFGGAYGSGWLLEEGNAIGRVTMFELFAGADFGAQVYRTILFFKTEKALRNFKKGTFEFTGQANAAHVVGGYSAAPSYHPEVAMFMQVRGGLLLEASVGTQRYDYFPIPPSP